MPEEAKTVDIDTSGPGAEINLQEDKKENEIEVSNETVENNTESNNSSEESNEQLDVQSNEQETEKKEEVVCPFSFKRKSIIVENEKEFITAYESYMNSH